LKEVDFPD
jgi:hypothetical protein